MEERKENAQTNKAPEQNKPLEVEIVLPSGRQDGNGKKITVVYLDGRNPI